MWECTARLSEMEERDAAEHHVQKWPKHEHLKRMIESKCFRYTKEIVLHHREEGNADRFIGILLSQGGIRSLLDPGQSEEELGISRSRLDAMKVLGERQRRWYWSSRVRIGVK